MGCLAQMLRWRRSTSNKLQFRAGDRRWGTPVVVMAPWQIALSQTADSEPSDAEGDAPFWKTGVGFLIPPYRNPFQRINRSRVV